MAMSATVASAAYAKPMLRLAASARAAGFACLVVQQFSCFEGLLDPSVRSLSVPSPPLLPQTEWCGHPRYLWLAALSYSSMYRTRLWHVVLEAGVDLLAIDLDWTSTDANGFALQPSAAVIGALRATRTASGAHADGGGG